MLEKSIKSRLTDLCKSNVVDVRSVQGGYSSAYRAVIQFENGGSVFLKVGTDELTANWLRDEYHIYSHVHGDFMPHVEAWDDDNQIPILLLEDLSTGSWTHVWQEDVVKRVLDTVKKVHQTPPPPNLASLEAMRVELTSWCHVAQAPESFLGMRLCSSEWLESALPQLLAAEKSAVLQGSQMLHLDIRSDNICFAGHRTLIVDWNWACVGNADLDVIFWLPSVALEGGPQPHQILDAEPNLVALVTGYWALRAGLPPPRPDSTVREIQRRQLEVALPWCAKVLGLPETFW